MKNVSPLLINMPTEMAEIFRQLGSEQDVSRTKVILNACRDYIYETQNQAPHETSKQPTNKRTWTDAFYVSSGTGI